MGLACWARGLGGRETTVSRIARLDQACWLAWARAASLGFAYRLEVAGQLVAYGATDHAIIDATGAPKRLPATLRERLAAMMGGEPG